MSEVVVLRPGKKSAPPSIAANSPQVPVARKDLNWWLKKALKEDSRVRPGFAEAWIGDAAVDESSRLARYYVGEYFSL
jgi:hypothetical protein